MQVDRARRSTRVSALAVSVLASCLALTSKHIPFLIYNGSQSAPIGLYLIYHSRPNRGDLVLVRPWPELVTLLARHDILPPGVPLLKTVAALTDDHVCRDGSVISINGVLAAEILDSDANGYALSGWLGCRTLVIGEFFLLQPNPRSFDSRYFGPALSRDVIGIAKPI
jgi:type IV secretory pathway protease TraF